MLSISLNESSTLSTHIMCQVLVGENSVTMCANQTVKCAHDNHIRKLFATETYCEAHLQNKDINFLQIHLHHLEVHYTCLQLLNFEFSLLYRSAQGQ